jgi:hypothetical protein
MIPAHNECVYDECERDDECRRNSTSEPKSEEVCDCGEERHVCSPANCRANSDCPPPYTCGDWRYCHSAADACKANADCKVGDCVYSWEVKHYVCKVQEHIAPD